MANEFKHTSVGSQLSQTEYEAVGGHVFDSQAAGDIPYASSTSQLSRLGIGTAGKVLMVNSGASAPEWSAALTGVTSIYATDLIIGEDSQTAIDFGTANEIDFKVDNANRLTLTASALYPATDNQIDLGTSSLEFKDAYFDGTVTADAFAGPLTGNADTATLATTVTITDNESTDEDNAVVFTAGGDVDGGSLGLESDGNLTYNPSTGRLTATQLAGTIQTASQTNITGVGTISTGVWQGTAIASTYIAADAITGAKIADDAIDSEHYTDGSIDTAHIADNQVTAAKLFDLARGSILIGNASAATAELTVGSANYVLTSDGTDIAWASATTGDITGVTAGDGISGGGTSGGVTVAVDLGTNSGLEIDSNKLQIAKGISQHDVPQFTSGVDDDDFLRVAGTVVEGRSASEVLSDIGARGQGVENMWVPATAMTPSETNGCASITVVESGTNKPDFSVLDFDPSSDEYAQFSIAMPKSWNEGTITFQPYWTVTGTNGGTVAWELSGFSYDSDDPMSAFTGSVTTTALAHSGTSNDLMISVVSGNITIQGSPAAEDLCFFRINRDVSADTQTGDARLIGIKIIYTTDAATDA
tara:strand:- start:247 stop:2013 length:1767 start_codon:yes stop_codon:yes gene_type:complete